MGAFFTLALLSKESAGTLPVLAVFYEHFCRDDRTETRWTQKAFDILRFGHSPSLISCFACESWEGFFPLTTFERRHIARVALEAIALIGKYVGFSLWPVSLCAARILSRAHARDALWPSIFRRRCGAGAPDIIFVFLWNRARLSALASVVFGDSLSGLESSLARDQLVRDSHLPSAIFICRRSGCAGRWLGASLACSIPQRGTVSPVWRWARGIAGSAFAVVVALSVVRIVVRNRDWRDELTFYTRTLAISPNSFEMRESLGVVYYNRGDLKGAEREWQRARQISPLDVSLLDSLGLLFIRTRADYDEAAGR